VVKVTLGLRHWLWVLQCAVSLLFSFMIVWDLPTLQRGAKSLRTSRLSAVYEEIAPAVSQICLVRFSACVLWMGSSGEGCIEVAVIFSAVQTGEEECEFVDEVPVFSLPKESILQVLSFRIRSALQ
jgi:hypothetical protein